MGVGRIPLKEDAVDPDAWKDFEPIGKDLEILYAIAANGPCTQYSLREMKGETWSHVTIRKRVVRLEREGMIARGDDGFEATDRGFFEVIERLARVSASDSKRLVKLAMQKFPNGSTANVFSWMLTRKPATRQTQIKMFRGWCQRVGKMLDKNTLPVDRRFKMEITKNQAGQTTVRYIG